MASLHENTIGDFLRQYRRDNKLSQQEMAELLNISQSYMGCLERGTKKPSRNLLLTVSNRLNISIDKLLISDSDYSSKQSASEYVDKIQSLSKDNREKLYSIIDIFISVTKKSDD